MAASALILALDLVKMPSMVAAVRRQPLPPDVSLIIRIAGGSQDTLKEAMKATRAPPGALRMAAVFYIQEILFQPGADHYRVLGATPGASREHLRENMRWLLRWLHPDHNQDPLETAFVDRVLTAWRELASTVNRAAYDRTLPPASTAAARRGIAAGPLPIRWVPIPYAQPKRRGAMLRFGPGKLAVAGLVFMLGLVVLPASVGRVTTWLGWTSSAPGLEGSPAPRAAPAR